MLADAVFDDIVSGFYAAAHGTRGWVEALVPFQRCMRAVTVVLFAVDPSRGCVVFSYEASDLPAEASIDYLRTYHPIDSRAQRVLALPPGEWFHCWEHFDEAHVAADPFYQQFLIPYGSRYASGIKLLEDPSMCVILGVHRGPNTPVLDTDEKVVCTRLARHLKDAVVAHRGNERLRIQGRLGMELLARMRAPVALLDEQRTLVYANTPAKQLLSAGRAVVERGGRFYCCRSQDDVALTIALRRLLADPSEGVGSDKVFLKARSPAGNAVGLYVYCLRPKDTLRVFGDRPLAMLMLHEPDHRVELDPFVVAAAFDLTPGEARVAIATAHGASPEDIATTHRVSIHTIRAQLRTIFSKTGTTRQPELVSLLAGLPMAALGLDG